MHEEHHDMEDSEEHQDFVNPWYKGPIKIIIGIFLILLMILWLIPAYAIKTNNYYMLNRTILV